MSEFIRLQANGADAYPDASTENTYRPNGTSVESALVNLESNVTTLGGVAGDAKTLAEQNSVKIATAEQEISAINSSLTAKIIKRTYSLTSDENGICYIPEITGYTIFNVVNKSSEWAYVRPYYDFRCFFVIQAKSGEILINSTFEYSVYYLKET